MKKTFQAAVVIFWLISFGYALSILSWFEFNIFEIYSIPIGRAFEGDTKAYSDILTLYGPLFASIIYMAIFGPMNITKDDSD